MAKSDTNGHLSIEQRNAVDLLVTGRPDREVGEAVGVARQTVCSWRRFNPVFQAELNSRRAEISRTAVEKVRALIPRAIDRLEAELDRPAGWRVALKLMEIAGLTELGKVGPSDADTIIDEVAQSRRITPLMEMFADSDGGPMTAQERAEAVAWLQERAAAMEQQPH